MVQGLDELVEPFNHEHKKRDAWQGGYSRGELHHGFVRKHYLPKSEFRNAHPLFPRCGQLPGAARA
jgi:hypothetical protein